MVGFTLGIGSVPIAFGSDSLSYITYKGGNGVFLHGISRDGKLVFGSVKDVYLSAATFDGEWHLLKTGSSGNTSMDGLSGDGLTAYGTSHAGSTAWKLGKGRTLINLPTYGYELGSSSLDASVILAKGSVSSHGIWANDQVKLIETPPGYDFAAIAGISDDGKTWIGTGGTYLPQATTQFYSAGLIWKDSVASTYSDPDFDIKVFNGISPDGKTLFGVGAAKNDSSRAERTLVIKNGVAKEFGRPGGFVRDCNIKQISADGTVAIGTGHSLYPKDDTSGFAALWDADGNFCDAGLLLQTMGFLPTRPASLRLIGISADGQSIVGDYISGSEIKSFILRLQKGNWPYLLNRTFLREVIQGDQPQFKFSIARPAPKGGIKLSLRSSSDRISVPATALIPAGQTSTQIRFRTAAPRPGVDVVEGVTITVDGPVNTEVCNTAVYPFGFDFYPKNLGPVNTI